MRNERARRAGEQWEYRCDECGDWNDRGWLIRGRLLCLACYTVSGGLDIFERLKRGSDLMEALQRQRQKRRRLANNGKRGPPGPAAQGRIDASTVGKRAPGVPVRRVWFMERAWLAGARPDFVSGLLYDPGGEEPVRAGQVRLGCE